MKTNKSGKITVSKMEDYIEMGLERIKHNKEISFQELRTIQNRINDTTRYWVKILGAGKHHKHTQRILESKLSDSCNVAPSYYIFQGSQGGRWL